MTRSTIPTLPLSGPLLLAMLAAVALAGCSRTRGVAAAPSLEALAGAPAVANWSALRPDAALLRLPDGRDRPVSLRERRQAQSLIQEIELPARRGTGRNVLSIAVHGEAAQPGLYPGKPSEAGIKAEIASAFPGRAFRVVAVPRSNAHGPYGLAVSAGPNGQRCVYAWQWLERDDRRVAEALGGSASWRARICRKAQSLEEIAAALDGIAIGAEPGVAAAPEAVDTTPGRTVRRRAVRSPAPPAEAGPRKPQATLPSRAPGGRRYLAEPQADPRLPAGADGARTALDQSLPAEAYRGPVMRAIQTSRLTTRDASASRPAVPSPN